MALDVAVLSLGTTPGLRRTDEAFAAAARESGASCEVVTARIGALGRLRRHVALNDAVEALAARRAAGAVRARAIVYSTVTATFFQRPEVPFAVRFDAPAALNRPGPGGAWQRARERHMLSRARLLLPLGEAGARAVPPGIVRDGTGSGAGGGPRIVTLPVPVETIAADGPRDVDAVTHGRWPKKRGLELVCAAWAEASEPGQRLVIGGVAEEQGRRWLARAGVPEPPGLEWAGELPRQRWLALVARARAFVNGSRWEGHGLAHLEALGAGTPLVTVPSPGAYEALPLARRLAPELVASEVSAAALAPALRRALAMDGSARRDYSERARRLVEPYGEQRVRQAMAGEVLPALGIRP